MANPLSGLLGSQMGPGPQKGNNIFGLIQQFNQFKSSFQGDPRQKVQDLLNSGEMKQEQLDQCISVARWFQNFIH